MRNPNYGSTSRRLFNWCLQLCRTPGQPQMGSCSVSTVQRLALPKCLQTHTHGRGTPLSAKNATILEESVFKTRGLFLITYPLGTMRTQLLPPFHFKLFPTASESLGPAEGKAHTWLSIVTRGLYAYIVSIRVKQMPKSQQAGGWYFSAITKGAYLCISNMMRLQRAW